MSSIIALILCSAIVLFLLRLERKQSPDVSRALWIPTIWMLYIASKRLAHWFPSSGATLETSPLDRTFLIALFCMALWILIRRRFDWLSAIKENIWLIVLIAFMFVSIFWSKMPGTSFFRWGRQFVAVVMAFVVLSEPFPYKAIVSILRRTAFILIPFSFLLIKYFPHYGVQYGRWSGIQTWIGVTMQKNGLGRLCIITSLFLIWSIIRRWKEKSIPFWNYQTYVEIVVLFITLWLLRGPKGETYSATGYYALGAGLIAYLGFQLIKKLGINLRIGVLKAIVAIIIIAGTVSLFIGGSNLTSYATFIGRDATLTGRTNIWAALLPIAMQKPIVGNGFGGFWVPRIRAEIASEAHSGYLDVLIGTGFVGLFLVSMFLLSSCHKAHREQSHNYDWGTLWICYIIMAVVHNITETSIDSFSTHLTAVILFFTVSSAYFVMRKH